MIKRIRFVTGDGDWRERLATVLSAPDDARPLRVTAGDVLTDVTAEAVHSGVGTEWFHDAGHLRRLESWEPDSVASSYAVVVAEERVMRGADWLERRWRDGGPRLKQMAIALRAEGLTPAQFSELWRNRAGKVGATPIPDEAKGVAYVQNHPLPVSDVEWAYDAVNEVYFDDLDGMRARIRWFDRAMREQGEDDLVRQHWFLGLSETPLTAE